MSGAFSRTMYDRESQRLSTKISTAKLGHVIDPSRNHVRFPTLVTSPGVIGGVGVSTSHGFPLVDVETELIRGSYVRGGSSQSALCHLPTRNFGSDYTRISNPICTARGVGVNRFDPICSNPQSEERWLSQAKVGLNCRNVVRDNYVPRVPVPLDQSACMPKRKKVRRKKCSWVCSTSQAS